MKFKFIDHPKILEAIILGNNLEELFSNAALAMMTFLYPKEIGINDHESKENIILKSSDHSALLNNFLTEILYLTKTKNICYNSFDIIKLTDNTVELQAYGRRVKRQEIINDLISHKTQIKPIEFGWEAVIIFDI
ncbi:MAG: hypothetical protein CMI53_04985 [Parcubacteria group bacterium]|nr:hypothetical protein [Parcubacteria group bacterium]|tara:strand:+ start:21 stop:425 length:405 start_codon:yes stop_codon:yes gene_type:complete